MHYIIQHFTALLILIASGTISSGWWENIDFTFSTAGVNGEVEESVLSPDSTLPYLNITEFVVIDTSQYATLDLQVINPGDSLVVIEQLVPSCGCVLATVQNSVSMRNSPAHIYVAVTVDRLDSLQPITIDVVTNRTRQRPLRLNIRKQTLGAPIAAP